MTRVTTTLLLAVLILALAAPELTFGQEMIIEPTQTGGPYLNEIIAGDTTATGARVDPDRIYVLRRDGIYLINAAIMVRDFDLRLMTEAGEGTSAIVYPVVNTETQAFPDPVIDMRGHIWVKDVALAGYADEIEDEVENINSTIVRTNAPGFDLIMEGVIMSNTRGQHIRTESAARVVRITDSILANMGDLGRSNFGAGKGIDLRANSVDSLVFQNCTFVNFQDRIIRHRSSTAAINHLVFDHNTVINGMSYHGTIALGWMGEDAVITNNLFLDAFVAGADSSDGARNEEFDEHGELFPNGEPSMPWIFSVPNDSTQWTVSNNYFATSAAVQAFYETYGDGTGDNDVIGAGPPLSDHILQQPGADDFVEVDLEVANRPDVMIDMAVWYRTQTGRTKATDNFVRAQHDFDRQPLSYFLNEFDASYPTDSPAYSGAVGGFPAGDLNWFPARKADWIATDVERIGEIPVAFQLDQNYPNPFNPTTSISYGLPNPAKVSLVVYDQLGREVARLIDGEQQTAGSYRVTWNGTDQSGRGVASGVYFYQLRTGEGAMKARKMVLVK